MTTSEVEESQKSNLPWVEKYRPNSLDDLISHRDILTTIERYLKEDRLPHMLFYGPPGTGKTSTILAIAKRIYTPQQLNSMVLELNASDDRGIAIVRGQVLTFASTRTIFKSGFKIVILDEADAMTKDAQNALRRIIETFTENTQFCIICNYLSKIIPALQSRFIEKFTENTRFCIICNYLSKIIPALQSRCTRFRFGPLSTEQMMPRLEHIIEHEKVSVTEDGKKALVTLANGDMRKVLNILQSASMAFDIVSEDAVYTCVGHPLRADIHSIVHWMLNDSFVTAVNNIVNVKTAKGLALQDILTEVHTFVHRIDLPLHVRIALLAKMADVEHRLASGTSEKIQLSSLVAAFQTARDLVVKEGEDTN